MLGGRSQRATAGWLSMLAVFEPHWQVGIGAVTWQCLLGVSGMRCGAQ
jgi:hypothetical protein